MLVFAGMVCGLLVAQNKSPLTTVAFSPQGDLLLAGSQSGLQLFTWPDLKESRRVATDLNHLGTMVFAPDRSVLLVGGGTPAEKGQVEIFSWPDLKKLQTIQPHPDLVTAIAWSPDGARFATAGADGTCVVHTWNPARAPKIALRYEGHSRPVLALSFWPDGKRLLSAGVDQSLQLWSAETGKLERSMDNHLHAINDLAVRPKADEAAPVMAATVGEDRTLRLWQPATGRLVRFTKLESVPRAVIWSPSGDRLMTGCNDGRVLLFDPDSPNLTNTQSVQTNLGRIHSLAIHPISGKLVAGGEKGMAAVPLP